MFDRTPKRSLALAALALATSAGTASADISSIVFTITAELENGSTYPWSVELNPGDVDANGNYFWQLDQEVHVMDGTTEIFALTDASITIFADPSVALNFNVIAGQQNTVFSIDSANLSFAPLANAVGRATAAVSVSDLNGDGATLTPLAGGAYRSYYNGGGTNFQNLIGAPVVAAPFSSASTSDTFPGVGYQNIGTTLTDIESEWRFSLSAGDLAAGTSEFEVIPAPASVVLGLTALAGLRRRR
ncbi:MAG: hypothetical protein KDA31_10230 [Phycisphaerales bacterium]|nr:hypothetical protein [Phycisphaerales bacterium]